VTLRFTRRAARRACKKSFPARTCPLRLPACHTPAWHFAQHGMIARAVRCMRLLCGTRTVPPLGAILALFFLLCRHALSHVSAAHASYARERAFRTLHAARTTACHCCHAATACTAVHCCRVACSRCLLFIVGGYRERDLRFGSFWYLVFYILWCNGCDECGGCAHNGLPCRVGSQASSRAGAENRRAWLWCRAESDRRAQMFGASDSGRPTFLPYLSPALDLGGTGRTVLQYRAAVLNADVAAGSSGVA